MKNKMSEYGGKETYASKGAMMRHEGKEKPKMERMEGNGYSNGGMVMKGYAKGGMVVKVKGKNC
jgi:hypothetical protein